MISRASTIASKLTKPNSTFDINSLTNFLLTKHMDDFEVKRNNTPEKYISFWDYCRFYRIGQIPILDFVVGYIFLYCLNSVCPHFDYKFILIATIPMVITINIMINKKIKITVSQIVIIAMSIFYLWSIHNN